MKTIKVDKKNIDKKVIEKIASSLLVEEVVVLLTDTVYGLHCLAESKRGLEKIRRIKGRPKDMPFIVLIKSYCMLHDYFKTNKRQEEYIRSIWPRTTREAHDLEDLKKYDPTTLILEGKEMFEGAKNGVGVRLPLDELMIKVLKKVNKPLISTSLNRTGQRTLSSVERIGEEFDVLPDLVVDSGICRKSKGSAIVDVRDLENIVKIR